MFTLCFPHTENEVCIFLSVLPTHFKENPQLIPFPISFPASTQQGCVTHLEDQYPRKQGRKLLIQGNFMPPSLIQLFTLKNLLKDLYILTSDKGTDKTNYDLTKSRNVHYSQC